MRIEQFIYTNLKQRGRSIQYSTIDLPSLTNDFNKIMGLFQQITPSLNIVFSKFNDDYYIYYQCKEVGFERVGVENKKGRKGDIFIALLIPLNIIEKLNYDFALIHMLLSEQINWKKISTIIEEENSTLEPLIIEFNTETLTKKVINYVKNNTSTGNISFTKTKLKTNFNKILSDPNIINLINYSLSLPKDIGKDMIFSTLEIYHNIKNDDISITKNIPNNLYYEQISFLDNINKENYQILKNYPISTKDTIKYEKNEKTIDKSSFPSIEKESINFKKILKIVLYLFTFILALIAITPFYKYYTLTSIYTKDITLENLKNYKRLIDNNGFLLNSFTNIASKYKLERENFFVRNKKNILAFTYCDTSKLILTKNIIDEYKKDKNIKDLERKYLNLNICMLNRKIQQTKQYLSAFLDLKNLILKKELNNKKEILSKLKELIFNIKEYRKLTNYKNYTYYNDFIQYNIIYEVEYFEPIRRALKLEEKNDILKLIQNYEKHTILSFYKKDIQKIKMLLKKKEIMINIEVFSQKDKNVTIEYLGTDTKKIKKSINTCIPNNITLAWRKNSFLNIKDTSIFKGRLLKSLKKKFVKKNFLSFTKKYEFQLKLETPNELKLFSYTKKDIEKYIKKWETQ